MWARTHFGSLSQVLITSAIPQPVRNQTTPKNAHPIPERGGVEMSQSETGSQLWGCVR